MQKRPRTSARAKAAKTQDSPERTYACTSSHVARRHTPPLSSKRRSMFRNILVLSVRAYAMAGQYTVAIPIASLTVSRVRGASRRALGSHGAEMATTTNNPDGHPCKYQLVVHQRVLRNTRGSQIRTCAYPRGALQYGFCTRTRRSRRTARGSAPLRWIRRRARHRAPLFKLESHRGHVRRVPRKLRVVHLQEKRQRATPQYELPRTTSSPSKTPLRRVHFTLPERDYYHAPS